MVNKKFYLDPAGLRETLRRRLADAAPCLIQLVSGPRQVGKTTCLLALVDGLGDKAIYASLDAPESAQVGSWERLWHKAENVAKTQGEAVLFLDEIQHLTDWSVRLKGEWDRIVRLKLPIHVIASGSSSLELGLGSKESLAGRFERLTLPHWKAVNLAQIFSLSNKEAVDFYVTHGAYPGTVKFRNDDARWLAYVQEAIVEAAIGRDILSLQAVRRHALLRQIFNIVVSMPAQIISLQRLQWQLQDKGALATVSHYLNLLEEAFLVAALPKYTHQPLRQRQAPPKILVLNQALCAAMDPSGIPSQEKEPGRYGFWVENACLAFLYNSGKHVSYWREGEQEVDAVIDEADAGLAIEVKTGPYSAADLAGLFAFTKKYPQFKALVLCDEAHVSSAQRLGIDAMPWRQFLLQ